MRVRRQAGVANGKNIAMEAQQALASDAPPHCVLCEAQTSELLSRDHAVLPCGKAGERRIREAWSPLGVKSARSRVHTRLSGRGAGYAPRPSKAAIASAAEG
jgi:hypothetical protein